MSIIRERNQKKTTQSEAILNFYQQLDPSFRLPDGISIMNPFKEQTTWEVTQLFYKKFYNDADPRFFIFGINPGRFGGGITGIPFTDPIRLESECEIKNDFKKLPELSSVFVYSVINAYGGVNSFYRNFFITALSPLGFTKNGLNLNYYDDKMLLKLSEDFIVQCIRQQKQMIQCSEICFCLGEGTNYKIFNRLNERFNFFTEIIPLPHPRWVMQYRRKKLDEYVQLYVQRLSFTK